MRFFDKDHGPEPQDDDDWGEESPLASGVFCSLCRTAYQIEQEQSMAS